MSLLPSLMCMCKLYIYRFPHTFMTSSPFALLCSIFCFVMHSIQFGDRRSNPRIHMFQTFMHLAAMQAHSYIHIKNCFNIFQLILLNLGWKPLERFYADSKSFYDLKKYALVRWSHCHFTKTVTVNYQWALFRFLLLFLRK